MAVTYEKTFEIEIINELSASVYNRVLNYVLNHELDTKDTRLLEVNLLNQLEVAQEVDLFQQPFEELRAIHEYWRSMNSYSKKIVEMAPFLKGVI
ncbi:antitoxin [Enterococcus faecalis]|uniref:Antitoxin n=1 Tax=Enterococcus faecalis TaxID=1351 RepID=A0A5P9W8W6_ENTFL|nr:antitoxin [Enterococcus faecalis]MDT2030064.1 antitoxin [Enterococcus faecalis]QFX76017.1 antitoxin [Enterococcus faecalis]